MTGCRLAIVAEDQRLSHALQTYLKKALVQPTLSCPYAAVREHLGPDTSGVLVLAARVPEDVEHVLRLVQEGSLKQLPPVVLVVEEGKAFSAELDAVDPCVTRRLRWPVDAAELDHLVKKHFGRGPAFFTPAGEAVEEVINRRLLGHTPSLQMMVPAITLAATHDVPVLISGETGTGKTHLARLMHDCSPRNGHRFLVVSCGALSSNLIESELFGHARGAFTGADQSKEGKFAAAGEGTILLDEIDTLGLEQQANLLRVVETGEYEPVGSNQTKVCTARIIAASNWNLEEAVENGKFRQDLYYRLHVMAFHLPPLRDRTADIAPLVRGMTAHFNQKFRKGLFEVSPEVIAVLERQAWPGNIRQLENVLQQAVLVSNGPRLLPAHLPAVVQKGPAPVGTNGHTPPVSDRPAAAGTNGHGATSESLSHSRQEMERVAIQRALLNWNNSRTRAARALGISRVTLYKKMKKYGLMTETMPSASS